MTDQHFDYRHHEPFGTVTVFETFWMAALAAAVIGGLMLGLSALAQ